MKAAPMYALALFMALALAACDPPIAVKAQRGETATTAQRQAEPQATRP